MARKIAMLRPLCFAKWDRYFTFRDSKGRSTIAKRDGFDKPARQKLDGE
jgi:hypothetical protein